jgi:NADH-quinone oxidoreductase subunit N
MYFDDTNSNETITMTPGSLIGQLILLAGTVYFGIVAGNIINATVVY